ncbi:hypothetical protein IFM89_013546 [Coptis chinensis]|uniref:BED-type domain-containing protein n=1 Tax=Coptis chinensis TaxID=261450 RepID=A0A835I277_9MAGN|nr:hypothetical protein IFM89_013546 [Coptis chinensis]
MVRGKDPFWQYGEDLKGHFTCKFCKCKKSGGISRLKAHLSCLPGMDVVGCTLVPEDVQAEAVLLVKEKEHPNKKLKTGGVQHEGTHHDFSALRQNTVPSMCDKKDKEHVDHALGHFFFDNNIAFNVFQSQSFIDFCIALSNYGSGFKVPSYSTLRTKLVQNAKAEVVEYVSQVKNSWFPAVTSLLRSKTSKELKKPCTTRFAYHFLMLQSIIDVEDGLRAMVASPDWRALKQCNDVRGRQVTNIIQGIVFWDYGKEVISVLEPLISSFRLVDGEGSTAGYLFEAMERAREEIKHRCDNDPIRYEQLWDLFDPRRDRNILHEVHALAAFLNPKFMIIERIKYGHPLVKKGLVFAATHMITIDLEYLGELPEYEERGNGDVELAIPNEATGNANDATSNATPPTRDDIIFEELFGSSM